MSRKHAIVTFPQRQIQLATRENNNRCKTHFSSSSLCPSQPAGWKYRHCGALCQLKRQMGKGEGFRATRCGGPGSSFSLYPPWASILNTFTNPAFTYRNVSAGRVCANTCKQRLRPEKGLSELFPLYTSLYKMLGWAKPCEGVFVSGSSVASPQAHWSMAPALAGQRGLHWGVSSFWWSHSKTLAEKFENRADAPWHFPRTSSWLLVNLHLRRFLRCCLGLVLWNYNRSLLVSLQHLSICRHPSLLLQAQLSISVKFTSSHVSVAP